MAMINTKSLEFFAGAARIARMGKALKLRTGALDRDMDASMDLNTYSGFLLLASYLGTGAISIAVTVCYPRLHLALLLQAKFRDAILVLGLCCSTYVAVNRGTSLRSEFLPTGNPTAPSVYKANKLTSRWGSQTVPSVQNKAPEVSKRS